MDLMFGMRQKLKYQKYVQNLCSWFLDNSYVTKAEAKSTNKKASEIGILINASSLMSVSWEEVTD
jgi:hypothetical protein